MILLDYNENEFEHDARSLLMAFFPGEEITLDGEMPYTKRLSLCFNSQQLTVEAEFEGEFKEAHKMDLNLSNRFDTKCEIKRLLYHIFSRYTKRELPWGTLTGIRPTKIAMAMLERGMERAEIKKELLSCYLASEEKVDLSIEIAEREKKLLEPIDYKNGYSLYIGIPFCPTTCLYCSFTSYPIKRWETRIGEYLEAVFRELDYVAKRMKGRKLNSIYIGGGTPTSLEAEHMEKLLEKVCGTFSFEALHEFTVEAGRPDSITRDKLKVMRKYPVSRISINPQTMKEETLRLIGRKHTAPQVKETFFMAREEGFDNINMDLIAGLPEEGIQDLKNTLEEAEKMSPDSITVHSLAIKRAARLSMNKDKYEDLKILNTEEMISLTGQYARDMGMRPYYLYRQKNMAGNFENVGYGKPGKEGIYNILIMEEKQTILAVGAGSSSKIVFPEENRIERIENVKDVDLYITRIQEMIDRKEKILANL